MQWSEIVSVSLTCLGIGESSTDVVFHWHIEVYDGVIVLVDVLAEIFLVGQSKHLLLMRGSWRYATSNGAD